MEEQNKPLLLESKWLIPLAIIGAGVLVAGAVMLSGGTGGDEKPRDTVDTSRLRPVTADDHLLGNPEADIVIVEFSDLECPFCKTFHATMKRVIEEYGESGKVAWVYRHFPLDGIHPKARKEAEATECAEELGGKVKFWEMADAIFSITPSNNNLDLSLLPNLAEELGIDRGAFEECLASGRHAQRIADDLADAIAAGGSGTPYSIMLTKDGDTIPVFGAESFETMKALIEKALE